jgi:hypothetical protein
MSMLRESLYPVLDSSQDVNFAYGKICNWLDGDGEVSVGKVALSMCEPYDLVGHIHGQSQFSADTFGPGLRTESIVAHIEKELSEIRENPRDAKEWIDVALLAFDGAWRAGYMPREVAMIFRDKQAENEQREWPDWRTLKDGEPSEHIRGKCDPGECECVECPSCTFYGCSICEECFCEVLP